ncbi:PDxFFG protein [Mycoplasma sp. Mirounga ES2805-ORL]|uniref:PDxFFG protein n=1 Tax=Mycoplasma sp. Mirounga ES2805-ORL TaxID=754514 RepID=UPI00197C649F|nr:PDxFFG protein [Mycoplasma sp. Mirounga ES2805-ORL]QSF13725.1 PDxFFG protein [Mycoplasma sp. Mirounga ES2805-ORL]
MSKKKFNWRTMVWPKYAISTGVILAATTATMVALKISSSNPSEANNKVFLSNQFVDVEKDAKLSFVNSNKEDIAKFDVTKGENGSVIINGQYKDVNEYLLDYYYNNQSMPFLKISYGPFVFYNEYVEAVSAKDFYIFTQWFMKNISWGPETITLKSFSIVKGVEMNGNNITLGAHSNKEKEYTTIKFYPDAFFGSLPMHSILAGQGNANDSLLYKVNKKLLSSDELKHFLKNVIRYNSLANVSKKTISEQSFRTINDKRSLINKKVWVLKSNLNNKISEEAIDDLEKLRLSVKSDYFMILNGNSESEARKNLKELIKKYNKTDKYQILQNLENAPIEQKTITNISFETIQNPEITYRFKEKYLKIIFNDGTSYSLFNSLEESMIFNDKNEWIKNSEIETIEKGYTNAKNRIVELVNILKRIVSDHIENNSDLTNNLKTEYKEALAKIRKDEEYDKLLRPLNAKYTDFKPEYEEEIIKGKKQIKEFQKEIEELNKSITTLDTKIKEIESKITSSSNSAEIENWEKELVQIRKEKNDSLIRIKNKESIIQNNERIIKKIEDLKLSDDESNKIRKQILEISKAKVELKVQDAKDVLDRVHKRMGLSEQVANSLERINFILFQIQTDSTVKDLSKSIAATNNETINEIKAKKASKLNEIFNTWNNEIEYLNKIFNGYNFVKMGNNKVNLTYYTNDLGFLPNQIISLESLTNIEANSQINWRDYANLDGFVRSLYDEVLKEFYIYVGDTDKSILSHQLKNISYEGVEINKDVKTSVEDLCKELKSFKTSNHDKFNEIFKDILIFSNINSNNSNLEQVSDNFNNFIVDPKSSKYDYFYKLIAFYQKYSGKFANDSIVKEANNQIDLLDKNSNSELNKAKNNLNTSLASTNYKVLLEKLNNIINSLKNSTEEYKNNSINYVKLMSIQAYINYKEENSSDKKNKEFFYNDLVTVIPELNKFKSLFDDAFDNIENTTKELGLKLIEYKQDVVEKLKEAKDLYLKLVPILESHKDLSNKYAALLEQSFNNYALTSFDKVDKTRINDKDVKNKLNQLTNEVISNIAKAKVKASNNEKLVLEYMAKLVNVEEFVTQIANKYSIDEIEKYINAYYRVMTNKIALNYNDKYQENTNDQKIKWVARLFTPLVVYQLEEAKKVNADIYKNQKLVEEIKSQIANTSDLTLKNKLQSKLYKVKGLIKYQQEQFDKLKLKDYKSFIDDQKIKSLWNRKDFDFDLDRYSGNGAPLSLVDSINSYNLSLANYINLRNELLGRITYFKAEVDLFMESAFALANFSNFESVYRDGLKNTAKLIKELRLKELAEKETFKNLYNENDLGIELNNNNLIIARSKVELLEILTNKGILTKDVKNLDQFEKDNIRKVRLDSITKNGKKLVITFDNALSSNDNIITNKVFWRFNLDANVENKRGDSRLTSMIDLFKTIGYKKLTQPTLIKEEGTREIKDENGKASLENSYSIYAESYSDLTQTLMDKVPWAAEWLTGEHLVKKLNDQGVFEYSIENGRYLGFNSDSRVGLWAILAMSDPNFKGISIDFLKFVAAHEYGHHMTLNGATELGDKGKKPVYVSALVPGATPHIANFYSKEVFDLYLKARTHLDLATGTLLKEKNVVKTDENGEYSIFKLARKDAEGNIVFDEESLEKMEDIWGFKEGEDNLAEALKNKKRRFLQDYQGLLEATIARRKANNLSTKEDEKWLQIFDIWMMNSLDQNSGTLSPSFISNAEHPAKYMIYNESTKEYEFKPASIEMLKGILKDGLGKPVEFETINGQLLPKIVEWEKDSSGNRINKIKKICLYNKNGTPYINVPIGIDFDDPNSGYYDVTTDANGKKVNNTVKFIEDKIRNAVNVIKSLIVEQFVITGWNSSTTNLTTDPKVDVAFPLLDNIFGTINTNYSAVMKNSYLDYVKARDFENGTIKKESNGKEPLAKFYNNDGTVGTGAPDVLQEDFFVKPNSSKLIDVIAAMYTGNGKNLTLSSGGSQVFYFDKDHQYLPNVMLDEAFTEVFFASGYPKSAIDELGMKPLLKWIAPYIKEIIGNDIQKSTWLTIDEDNNVLGQHHQYESLPAIYNLKKMKLNSRFVAKSTTQSLFDSFYTINDSGKKLYGLDVEFSDAKKWLEFSSIDTTRAKLDRDTLIVNWDIDYVKSHFDLEVFWQGLKDAIESDKNLTKSQLVEYKQLVNSRDKQALANEIMKRFSSSKIALFVKDISLGEIKNKIDSDYENRLRYAWIFDKQVGYGLFKTEDIDVAIETRDLNKWDISIKDMFKAFSEFATANSLDLNQLTLFDQMILDNKTQMYSSQLAHNILMNKLSMKDILASFVKGIFKKAKPTDDVVAYFASKTERKYNQFFSDYTFCFAEVINRDNLQITYSPSNTEFSNLPKYLSGINESNTGLEYVVDGTTTGKWNDYLIDFGDQGTKNSVKDSIKDYELVIDKENELRSKKLNMKHYNNMWLIDSNYSDDRVRRSSYFGEFQSINNGWFKDRWYRDIINFKLYDDKGKDIEDNTIRIKDLKGNKVNHRAKAFWQYYIQSQGIGKRNISNIWRDSDKDAVAMFGYLSSDVANKAEWLVFEDIETGEKRSLKIHKEFTNNMFYYKFQNPKNESTWKDSDARHYISDEEYDYSDTNGHHAGKGFISWVSDYGIMSRYKNKVLTPGHKYLVYFSNKENGNQTLKIDLGTNESISENGKTWSQAPTAIYKDKDGKIIMRVNDQFNGII